MAETNEPANTSSIDKNANVSDETFGIIHVLCVFISLITILADFTTDVLVFAEYCTNSQFYWALATLIFLLTPNILVNTFSLRWILSNEKGSFRLWITHILQVGQIQRYVLFMKKVFACQNLECIGTKRLLIEKNELHLLHYIYIFTGTIPQVILQTYAIISLDDNYNTRVLSLFASISSVVWGYSTYIYSTTLQTHKNYQHSKVPWKQMVLKLVWHFGMLLARVWAILFFVLTFGVWTLVPLGIHWTAMTFWIVTQKTTFCSNKLEETLYNVVMGFVYCFCYVNLKEGQTRYRLIMFYAVMMLQNFGSLFLYILISSIQCQQKSWSIAGTTCTISGSVIGLSAMISYYRYYHWKGPILWKSAFNEKDLNNRNPMCFQNDKVLNNSNDIKSFKSQKSCPNIEDNSRQSDIKLEHLPVTSNADVNFLLEHWIRTTTPTPATPTTIDSSMNISSIQIHTTDNTPQTFNTHYNFNKKKKNLCSPTELTLKLSSIENLESSIDEITSENFQKRREMRLSEQIKTDSTKLVLSACNILQHNVKSIKTYHISEMCQDADGSNKKTSSDSIDMDLDLSLSDINSSDINTFNENIVQKLCLSALKNIKVGNQDADIENIQKIALDILKEMYAKKGKTKMCLNNPLFPSKHYDLDTPTEILSVHDYENICAVNIAREAWGLRSWNGYCDIENWLHDSSIVRDRRRDTFTSESSEISSCLSNELKNAIMSAPTFPRKTPTYSNVFVRFDRNNQDDFIDTDISHTSDETFLAKPCVLDANKDPYHLEPIIEELDDLGDIDLPNKKRLNSESSLVATIDEISKGTVANSPRNSYNSRNHLNCVSSFVESGSIDLHFKNALWKEPINFDPSNITQLMHEKENIVTTTNVMGKYNDRERDRGKYSRTESFSTLNKNVKRRQKSNVAQVKYYPKKYNFMSEPQIQDMSNKNIDILWNLVNDNSKSAILAEEPPSHRLTSSLQSLIEKESTKPMESPKANNLKRGNKPKRKFSILKEKFEPRFNVRSDEEILCSSSENVSQFNDPSNVVLKYKSDSATTNLDFLKAQKICPEKQHDSILAKSLQEKRSTFMKQV